MVYKLLKALAQDTENRKAGELIRTKERLNSCRRRQARENFTCFSYLPADLKDANTTPSVPGIGVLGKRALGETWVTPDAPTALQGCKHDTLRARGSEEAGKGRCAFTGTRDIPIAGQGCKCDILKGPMGNRDKRWGFRLREQGRHGASPFARLTTCCAPRKVASSSISFQGSDTVLGSGMYT